MCKGLNYDVGLPNRYQLKHFKKSDLIRPTQTGDNYEVSRIQLISVSNARLQLKYSVDTLYRNLQNDVD